MKFPVFTSFLAIALAAPSLLSAQEATPAAPAAEPVPAPAEDIVPLRPKFYPGKVYNYVTNTDVTVQIPSPPGQPPRPGQQISMDHHARLEVKPRSGGDTGVTIQASTDELKMEITSGDKKTILDSKKPSTDPNPRIRALSQHLSGATRKTMALDLNPAGKIVGAKEGGGGGPATPIPGMPQFGPDELERLVTQLMQGFPPDPVKPGDEWVQKGKRPLGQFGEIDLEITYRYVKDEEFEGAQCARIEYEGAIKGDVAINGATPGAAGGGGRLGFEGNELTGRLMFDKQRNAVRLSEQNLKMTVDAPTQGTPSGTIPVPITQKVVSKLVSVHDA